jgi:CRISPR-associated endonuclease Csn1
VEKSRDTANYRLGIDLGTNSLGWAAIKLGEEGNPCGILDMGVRIFSDGRNPKDGSSLAVQRRLPRGQRRRRDRYLQRRAELMDALVALGLMPSEDDERKALEELDPYALRARALDHPLTPFELGRALFHLDQRRGFKSNRKSDGDDENEAKKTRAEIDELRRRIAESGARTLGEFLVRRQKKGKAVRARPGVGLYPDRALYEDEFDAIRENQEPHHTLRLDQWDSLKEVIFFQRPLKPVDPGWCLLEAGERRAARALPIAQEFRMLQEVNNLKLRVDTDPERSLNDEERGRALARLRSGKNIDLEKPTKDLRLPSGAVFNLSRGGRKTIKGDETTARLLRKKEKGKQEQSLFGDRWFAYSPEERNEIARFLINTDDPDIVRRKAIGDWGLDDAQADAVASVSLTSGYANLSEKAMRKVLPFLEEGRNFADAVVYAKYPHHSDFRNAEAHEQLPYYGVVLERDAVGADPNKDPEIDGEPARYGRIANPTVHIGLNQLRRVVNKLIEIYGKPEDIVVELARDLKQNREQRQHDQRRNKENRERNERFAADLKSAGYENTPYTRMKLRLWEEQGKAQALVCPYTGCTLSWEMVVTNQTEVDHILPFSQTLDDTMANKVVCIAAANREKGNRSPFEAFGHSPSGYDYDAILAYTTGFPDNKQWRFKPNAMERYENEEEFLGRQLNETRYLSRTARTYLAYLYDEKTEGRQRVRAIPGFMTARLRRGWGLEGILRVDASGEIIEEKKQRDDHRHHAIDAFVVANTTQGLLQRFSRAAASSHDKEERLDAIANDVPPWDGFNWRELKAALDRVVVSHKPDHGSRGQQGKTTGQLHNDTAYGLVKLISDGPSDVVRRKKLSDVKPKDLGSVRDPALQAALTELWNRVSAEGGKWAAFAERAANAGVRVNGRCQRVRSVRLLSKERVIPIKDRDGMLYKGYLPGGNEFADIWQMRDGSWQILVVPTFDANQPDFDIGKFRPATAKGKHKGKPDPAAKRLMRLHIDDMGALGEGEQQQIVRVRKITNAKDGVSIFLDPHNEADVPGRVTKSREQRRKGLDYEDIREHKYSAKQLREQGFRKVGVDESGRVLDPGPRQS